MRNALLTAHKALQRELVVIYPSLTHNDLSTGAKVMLLRLELLFAAGSAML